MKKLHFSLPNLSSTQKFLLYYLIYISLFFVLIEVSYFESFLHINSVYSALVTKISAYAIGLFTTVHYAGNLIYLPNATLEVKFGCNGLESLLLYFSAILSYPATLKQKSLGLLAGFVIVNLVNIVRIMVLGYVLIAYNDMFEIMHTYVTQNIMIVFVFLLFIVYLNFLDKDDA